MFQTAKIRIIFYIEEKKILLKPDSSLSTPFRDNRLQIPS